MTHKAILALQNLRVQNANAISSPLTWGFPAMSAFLGFMTALERSLGHDAGITFHGVGVICHGFEAQISQEGYVQTFNLTRNPLDKNGSTSGIAEEGRIHLDLTLVFDVEIATTQRGESERAALVECIANKVASMRLAGGSIMPTFSETRHKVTRTLLELVPELESEQQKQLRRLAYRWLPGFALVSREDLLKAHLAELQSQDPHMTALDAWLDLSRLNFRPVESAEKKVETESPTFKWVNDVRGGWIVPIPVGFASLSQLQEPGSVTGVRDATIPFRFVETVWSIGQWISPHRLQKLNDLFWFSFYDENTSNTQPTYRCRNEYTAKTLSKLD